MKKIKYLISILIFISIILSAQALKAPTQQKRNQDISKHIIEHYNKLRSKRNLPLVYRDTLLDKVVSTIFLNRKYKNLNGSYNEDSIRILLFKNGVIDYQYEIKDVLDKDASATFNLALLADKSNNIRIGYKRSGNKHVLLKTKSYLKFSYGTISARSNVIDGLHSKSYTASVKTDSIIRYFKVLNPDMYYYQLYNRIPLSLDKMDTIKRNEVQTVKPTNKDERKDSYDFVIKTMDSDLFLVISNQNGERVAVIK